MSSFIKLYKSAITMNSFEVTYYKDNGEISKNVLVGRVKRAVLPDLLELHRHLMRGFLEHNASVGSIVSDPIYWGYIEQISAMLPIVGTSENLDLSLFSEDLDQIGSVFFTQSPVLDTGVHDTGDGGFLPSKISALHQLNYQGELQKIIQELNQ